MLRLSKLLYPMAKLIQTDKTVMVKSRYFTLHGLATLKLLNSGI